MEQLNEALEELKRVDHLIYVSLKYTRTVDVILNILNRMVDGYSLMVDAMLIYASEHGIVVNEPESAVERAELVRSIYGRDQIVTDNMGLYVLLRKLLRARQISRENEYRRHVTMKTVIDGREEIVTIDIITNYYLFQREFIMHVRGIIEGKVPVDLEQKSEMAVEQKWEQEVEQREEEHTVVHRTPPKKATVKVRPVGAPPRKRAPRPKKYKIQIPKGKNSITLPYEYDPQFRKEMEKEKARLKEEKEKKEKAAKKDARKLAKKTKPKKQTPQKKKPKKK